IRSFLFFFSSRRRHTRSDRDWSSDVCSSDLDGTAAGTSEVFSAYVPSLTPGPFVMPTSTSFVLFAGLDEFGDNNLWVTDGTKSRSEERRVGKECRSGWAG